MISEKTLSRILGYLDEEDRTPDETGCYTVSNTIFGCSSLSRGGSFCDKANNLILSDEIECGNLGGVEERASWPGVYSIVFHPEKMTEESAEKLLEYLVLMDENRRWSEMPCIDENRVYEMEDKEIRETLAEAVQGIIDESKRKAADPRNIEHETFFHAKWNMFLRFGQSLLCMT